MKRVFSGVGLLLALLCQGVFAKCDAKELLVRLSGAIESGAIDGTVLTYDNRARFIRAFLNECPKIKTRMTNSKLSDLLESVTAGWQHSEIDQPQAIRDQYYSLKQAGLISNLTEIGEIVTAVEKNPNGLCDSKEIASRFMFIGDCQTRAKSYSGIPGPLYLHVCVSSVDETPSDYIHFTDLCPQVDLSWVDLREVVFASKVEAGMSEHFYNLDQGVLDSLLKSLREPHYIKFKNDLVDVVDRQWRNWRQSK